jgi:DNA-binding CsgD family transcriptional regulator
MKMWNINPEALLHIPGNVWIYWKDIHGAYLGSNDQMADALNHSSPKEIIGKTDYDLSQLHCEGAKLFRHADRCVMSQGITKHSNDCAILQNKIMHFHTIKIPLYQNYKQLIGIVGLSYFIKNEQITDEIKNKYKNNNACLLSPRQINNDKLNQSIQLTNREMDCAKLILRGNKIKEIASALRLSPRTVETHLNNLKIKLACRDKVELAIKLKDIIPTFIETQSK